MTATAKNTGAILMSDSSRFRFHKNGPEASAIYNQKHDRGCYGCRYSQKLKSPNEPYYCIKSIKGYPNHTKYSCSLWDKNK